MRSSRRLLPFLSSLACLALACAINPVTGQPEVSVISPEREAEMGQQAAEAVEAEIGLVEDAKLSAYVDAVGQRVAAHSPRREVSYSFRVVDMEEPNAFALPGGYVYVSRGLLALANSEDELANVIGHEIGHVAARHAAQRQTRALGLGVLMIPSAILGAALGTTGDLLGAPILAVGAGLIAGYSRGQEHEADRLGQELASRGGYDPQGLPQFLRTLEEAERLQTGETNHPSFFDSHPATPERVESTVKYAGTLAWTREPGIARDRRGFLGRLEGLLIGASPAEGVFRDESFLHADLDFALHFPEGWETVNARSAVGAFSPERDARVVLELQGQGSDPRQAAESVLAALAQEVHLVVQRSESLRIGRLPAHRARAVVRTSRGPVALDVTWIAHRNLIFRLGGAVRGASTERYEGPFGAIAASFRPLTPADRERVWERRLRVAVAREGERLAELVAGRGKGWSVEETAVANDLPADVRLSRDQSVKVAVIRVYRPVAAAPGAQ